MKSLRLFPMLMTLTTFLTLAAFADGLPPAQGAKPAAAVGSVDCSAAYGGQPTTCEQVPCDQRYSTFLGTWSGQFWSYERKKSTDSKSVYRPYRNSVAYSASDCLKDPKTGDIFIMGHQTDDYPVFQDLPAKTTKGLLITGRKADGSPFLRTVGQEGSYDYALVYRNTAAKLAIWKLTVPGSGSNPPMTFTTIDGKDFTVPNGETRDVTVTMAVGPVDAPYWEGVIAYGSHTRNQG